MGDAGDGLRRLLAVALLGLIVLVPSTASAEDWRDPTSAESIAVHDGSVWVRVVFGDTEGAEARALYSSGDGGVTWSERENPPSEVVSMLAVVKTPARSHCLPAAPLRCIRLVRDEKVDRTFRSETER